MKFIRPLLQLPITFSADRLRAEVEALAESAWTPHPQGFGGNDAIALVSPHGALTDQLSGPMAPTEHLLKLDYLISVMGELGSVWGRSRLMRLAPGAEVPPHVDLNHYWRTHIRIHIPVITNSDVIFTCGDDSVHMAAGECWVFDSFQLHDVQNRGSERRVHLVLDTVGGDCLWQLIDAAESGAKPAAGPWFPDAAFNPLPLRFEQINLPKVMSPWEIRAHVCYLSEAIDNQYAPKAVLKRVDRFVATWFAAWSQFGESDDGLPAYRALIAAARQDIADLRGSDILLTNSTPLSLALDALIFSSAVAHSRPFAQHR